MDPASALFSGSICNIGNKKEAKLFAFSSEKKYFSFSTSSNFQYRNFLILFKSPTPPHYSLHKEGGIITLVIEEIMRCFTVIRQCHMVWEIPQQFYDLRHMIFFWECLAAIKVRSTFIFVITRACFRIKQIIPSD